MRYRELDPIPELAEIVHCVWMLTGQAGEAMAPEPIMPDGRPEIVLHFGDPFERVSAASERVRQPSMVFAGQLTSQLLLRPTGRIAVVGVRLHSYGAASLLRVPQHELGGLTIGVESLSTRLGQALSIEMDRHAPGGGADEDLTGAAMAVQHVLLRSMHSSGIDSRVRATVDAIARTRGRVSVDRLSDRVGITRRHLERRFLDIVGITPKRLARIARFQHALHVLEREESPGAETALSCGYADQSHFIRDFRQLAGCSPSAHVLRRAELTAFFIER